MNTVRLLLASIALLLAPAAFGQMFDYGDMSWFGVVATPAASGGEYTYTATKFQNASYEYVARTNLTGAANGKIVLCSFWFKYPSLTEFRLANLALGTRFRIHANDSGTGKIFGYDVDGNTVLYVYFTPIAADNTAWHHIIFSCDLASGWKLYLDGVSVGSQVTRNNTNMELAADGRVSVGVYSPLGGGTHSFCEFYFATPASYFDLDVQSNREKFRSAAGKPVSLGADGSLPTGAQPLIYLKNSYSTFHQNLGSGGDFIVTGSLEDDADTP